MPMRLSNTASVSRKAKGTDITTRLKVDDTQSATTITTPS